MAKKEVSIFGGAVVVVVDEKYNVYEKSLPSGIDSQINWLGSFGISEVASGKKITGKVLKYRIETPDKPGKKFYFWSDGKAKEVPGQKTVEKKNKKFRTGELDMGDPPIGWDY
ncbi:hypothetical protein ACFLXI_00705 [Chloroflexota bacterium]